MSCRTFIRRFFLSVSLVALVSPTIDVGSASAAPPRSTQKVRPQVRTSGTKRLTPPRPTSTTQHKGLAKSSALTAHKNQRPLTSPRKLTAPAGKKHDAATLKAISRHLRKKARIPARHTQNEQLRGHLKSFLGLGSADGRKAYVARKNRRAQIYNARFSDHGKKHLKAKDIDQAKKLSHKAAQYLPGIDNRKLERTALQKGTYVERGANAFWGIYRADKIVGYDGGKPTRWIRAEFSSGTFHGHPMRIERVRKYLKNAQE